MKQDTSSDGHGASAEVPPEFVEGYKAAWRDLGGPATLERAAIIQRDLAKSAENAYLFGKGWPDAEVEAAVEARDAEIRASRRRQPRARRKPGTVYVLHDPEADRVKIGWTSRPVAERQHSLEHASGRRLILLGSTSGTYDDETALHDRFSAARVLGEWFIVTPEVRSWIREEVMA